MSAWDDDQGAGRSDSILDGLRDEASERAGTKLPRTETYTVVHAAAPHA